MTHHSQFIGFGVQVELKDGKLIKGKIAKATAKGLTLHDVSFSDGGTSQAFKVRSSRLKDLKVLSVVPNKHKFGNTNPNNSNNNNNSNSNNNSSNSNNSKSNSNRERQSGSDRDDWQNEDVKRIKEQDDFDFQSNLNMFNKKDVFAQLKQQDGIDPNKRLVSHNKKSSQESGRVKQANYDIDEMVIPNAKNDNWDTINSNDNYEEFESTDDEKLSNVNHTYSNSSNNNEDNEEIDEDEDEYDDEEEDSNYLPITKSINITHLLHSAVNPDDSKKGSPGSNSDENKEILSKLEQMIIGKTTANNGQNSRSNSLSYNPTLKNKKTNQAIPMATPVQLLEMERIAEENFGITIQAMNEAFALNASYFIKQKLGGSSRLTINNSNPEPLVIILASDSNRSGNKALSLGKFLCLTQQVRVIILFTCSINEIQDQRIKSNLEIFKNCGGKIVNSLSVLKHTISKLNSPVELIIDAMQGFDCSLLDFYQSKTKIIEIINWCNEMVQTNHIKIYSIDMPSGYDSGSGFPDFEVSLSKINGVLCSYSWPLVSLNNMKNTIVHSTENGAIILVDCGIPKNVYLQKSSLRKFNHTDSFTTSGTIVLTL